MTDNHDFIALHGVTDIAALVPFLVGYQPQDALVLIAIRDQRILFTATAPLAKLTDATDGDWALRAVIDKTLDRVDLAGYGPAATVRTAAEYTVNALTRVDVNIGCVLRIHTDRLWSLHADGTETPAAGIAFDPNTTAPAMQAHYLDMSVAPDRDTLVEALTASLTAVTGTEQQAMARALASADIHLAMLTQGPAPAARFRVNRVLTELLTEAKTAYRTGRLPDHRAALLIRLLAVPALHDKAMAHVYGDDLDIHLWTDLTRRAGTDLAAGPATALALAALQHGDALLAKVAGEHARRSDPGNDFLDVIDDLIRYCVDPQVLHRKLHG
ncbi:DUF4192 domain-containing protein [Actinoplanes couchii]|uniref:DUF4192 domain-containing protein n=1 Tax=Actinoplanes couchii TaxID=403638 RepID=A0ABQ3XTJ2_9ACTN|nr:DUF4192 domain-containing protein [Actinoplanes couchii]MDR6318936.1 hypothetical protein [Actinoplanes couchii]GID61844.1 hypothetical protein Aco03nite_102480 [Actinoplanes couchii]